MMHEDPGLRGARMSGDGTMATVRLAADSLDPDSVSHILDHQPEIAARKGERLYTNSKSKAIARTGTWFLSSDGVETLQPEAHLEKLVSLISPHAQRLRDTFPGLKIKFSLYVPGGQVTNPVLTQLHQQADPLGPVEILPA